MPLVNARTNGVVAQDVEVAATRSARRRGLLGRAALADGAALVLTPCFSVHTIGMRFSIDVVFLDARGRVKKIVRSLGPRRIAVAFGASAVVELAAGALLPADTLSIGDRLYLTPESGESAERSRASVAPRYAPGSSQNSSTAGCRSSVA